MGHWVARTVGALACLVAVGGVAYAQAGARVSGTILDRSGLVLPGATVRLTGPDGQVVAETQSGADGTFRLQNVPAGTRDLEVQRAGFRTSLTTVSVTTTALAPVTVVLEVAGLTDSVTVTAARDERTLASVASSVGIVSRALLERGPGLNLAETLNFIPGVNAGNVSGVDDLRISIRGAGIRAGFGSRGVLLLTDGYPVTEPDGQTPHFDGQIDLAGAERVEVVKGPSSAIYGGAALGGVVNVISRVPSREPAASLRVEGGSYDFGKAHASLSAGAGPLTLSGTAAYTHLDGFRTHNSLRDWAGGVNADWSRASSRARISVYGTAASLDLPGTLNQAQLEADPSQSQPIYVTSDWGRENRVVRFGGRYERTFGRGHMVEIDSYGQTRDLFHPIFVVIDQQARRYVGHARYRWSRGRNVLSVGTDVDTQQVDDRWFVNVGGRPAFQIRDDEDVVTNLGVYAQDELALGSRVSITLGVRTDRIRYDLEDLILFDGDASDIRTFRRVSPKAAATISLRPGVAAYGNLSTGFEAPTLGEVRLPAGFNEEVRPQKAVSAEAGVRGDVGRLSYDAAFYRMVVDDEILPATIDNVTVYRNVARAAHTGLEVSSRLQATAWLVLDATYAYAHFTLDDFGVFSGNRLPGVPPHTGTIRASVAHAGGWDVYAALTTASSAFVSDANTEQANAYGAVSAGASHRFGRLRVFARGDNLGDARYTNRIQVNDGSGNYYYPAPGRNGTVGLEVRW